MWPTISRIPIATMRLVVTLSFMGTIVLTMSTGCGPRAASPSVRLASELDRITTRAAHEKSHALLVSRDNAMLVERYFDGTPDEPQCTMSVSKVIVAMVLEHMVDQRTIASLDEPAAKYVEEWSRDATGEGDRRTITIRHLLTHTSGLETERPKTWEGETFRTHAASVRVRHIPGSSFEYNDGAFDLLALVVHRASGYYLDDYLQRFVFGPLHVAGAFWMKDPEGEPRAAGELFLPPRELLKIGRLLLDRGVWDGVRVLSERATAEIVTPSAMNPTYGLGIWLRGSPAIWSAEGFLGQWLVVDPRSRWVAVRMHKPTNAEFSTESRNVLYDGFWKDIASLGTGR
jgi:CubicO group peptidase (beta-lactamase class C family)